ncbi:MAG TPA: serine protease [Verrucomicrobiae bacterium]|nr:serine protease [Verrucomicrobiae bacterium]
MKLWLPILLCVAAMAGPSLAQERKRAPASPWEHSVVTLEVSRKQYDYYQPWTRKTSRAIKTGIVLGDHQVLTTAEELFDRTLVRLQKGGRGRWYLGEVTWIDYYANLALVTTSEDDFWRELKPATLGGTVPEDGSLQIVRWHEGNLEVRRAEFTQFTVREGQLAAISQPVLQADSDILNAGWGEVITANSHAVGLVSSQDARMCTAIPATFIENIIEARKQGRYRGLGYFHFYWQGSQNPASLARLKLTGEPRGAIVSSVPPRPDGAAQVIHPQDIILNIDGFDLDIQGDYVDPEYGNLMLENLSTRNKWAGDEVKMSIWREGHLTNIVYRLPKYEYSVSLVPSATYDQDPEYLIEGGLVFQPLTDSYLQSWGTDWRRRAPFRLVYYHNDQPTKERPALVLMSQVLPDAFNIGYQEQRGLVVDKVNGQTISNLSELRAAFEKPVDGFHIIELVQSDSLRRIVLAAGASEKEATDRVLKRYGIDEPYHFAAKAN